MRYIVSMVTVVVFVAVGGGIGIWYLGEVDKATEIRAFAQPVPATGFRDSISEVPEASNPAGIASDVRVLPVASDPPRVSLSIVAWSTESDGNDPDVIADRLATFTDDVICLSEVHPESVERYKSTLSAYTPRLSRSGRNDRLMIFVSDRFEILETKEMDDTSDGRHRSPLYVRLKDNEGGAAFIVLTVHLARGNADFRTEQAAKLREWARDQTWPIIAIGDFYMDWDFKTEKGNEAFVEIMRDGVFRWLKPKTLIDTNWSDNDRYPDSMLDFAFAANAAKEWDIESSVIVEGGDSPDDERTSVHRSVRVVVEAF